MPNLHSHAFQRAMAGLTEHASGSGDSFWTWRETMYRFLARPGPDEVEAITAELQVDMLEAGYTAVGEFRTMRRTAAATTTPSSWPSGSSPPLGRPASG